MVPYCIDETRCTGCKQCFSFCPRQAIVMVDDKAMINVTLCDGCGLCLPVCAQNAIIKVEAEAIVPVKTKPPQPQSELAVAEKANSPWHSALWNGVATVLIKVVKDVVRDWLEGGASRPQSALARKNPSRTGVHWQQRRRRHQGG